MGSHAKRSLRCPKCGKNFLGRDVPSRRSKFCSRRCAGRSRDLSALLGKKMEDNPNWKGGLTKSTKGYWYVRMPEHPRAMKSGYVKRADLVLERKLGRPLLPSELAHHINENKEDDSPGNLEPHTSVSHLKLHSSKRRKPKPLKAVRLKPPEVPVAKLAELRKTHSLRAIQELVGVNYETIRRRLKKFNQGVVV